MKKNGRAPATCTCCSVVQSCLTLCDPVDCSTPGFPLLHYLRELAQTCPLSQWRHPTISSSVAPSSSAFSVSQYQGLYKSKDYQSLYTSAWAIYKKVKTKPGRPSNVILMKVLQLRKEKKKIPFEPVAKKPESQHSSTLIKCCKFYCSCMEGTGAEKN